MNEHDALGAWRPWSLRDHLAAGDPAASRARAEQRYREVDPQVLAWVERTPVTEPEPAGPLAGAPLGVKDVVDLAGVPTRCGSALRADAPPATEDAAIVAAWRKAGAVPVGKTVTTEFAYFSPGPTRNPARLGHTPGGSSSGSAAAVASGQVPVAIGAQTAGSVTRPAAYCGVASLVMTPGRFPTRGVVGLSPTLDAHGVFTATVADLAHAFAALDGRPDGPPVPALPRRVLLWHPHGIGDVDVEMTAAVDRVAHLLTERGVEVDALHAGDRDRELVAAHLTVMAFEAARERPAEVAATDRLSEPLAALLRRGAGLHDEEHLAALAAADRHRRDLLDLLATYDAVIGPAALGPAPAGLRATGDPVLSRPWQVLGLPTVGIPGLRSAEGLPLGLQAVGAPGREERLLATAGGVESVVQAHARPAHPEPARGGAR
ncbi:MAG: amidase [Nocardioides alkalitolerans]